MTDRGTRLRIAQRVAPFCRPLVGPIPIEQLDQVSHRLLPPDDFAFASPDVDAIPLLYFSTPYSCELLDEAPILSGEENAYLQFPGVPDIYGDEAILPVPDTTDLGGMPGDVTPVSDNLNEPLGRPESGGKDYGEQVGQENRIGEQNQRAATDTKYRRAYTMRRNNRGGRATVELSVWDMLLPLLQPPPFDIGEKTTVVLPRELAQHQPAGVAFLAGNECALLGDGVQTGKTIQAIVAMKLLFQCGKIRSALVVAPIAVLKHWQDRLEEWAPELWQGLTVVRSQRRAEREVMWSMPALIHLTNYETLANDIELVSDIYGNKGYDLIIADEVQRIKNADTETAKSLKKIGKNATYRWGLSATPIENGLDDLISIFEFLRPGLLTRGEETEQSAKDKFRSYFLRRETQVIIQSFKQPHVSNYWVEMVGEQLQAYELLYNQSVTELRDLGGNVTRVHALAKIQALKQLCNVHLPTMESAKLSVLEELLDDIVAHGDKVLVFSQYRECGMDFLECKLQRFGCINYGLAHADRQRQEAIEAFSMDDDKHVFVANPATAGTGLPDLKAANYVIHFDHWWNPAREAQADGRILGLGQRKDAFIAHLWVGNSIEGKIEEILERKRALFDRIVGGTTDMSSVSLSTEEMLGLFGIEVPRPETGGEDLTDISPRDMELLVGRVFSKMGYCARVTPQTRDGGIDVVAVRDTLGGREKVAIQCKHQRGVVGREVLQKLLGVISADVTYSEGCVVTSSTFSSEAKEFAEKNGRLKLISGDDLRYLCEHYNVQIRE